MLEGVPPAGSEHSRQSQVSATASGKASSQPAPTCWAKGHSANGRAGNTLQHGLSSPSRKKVIYSSGLRSIQKTWPGRGLETSTHTVQLRLGLKSQGQPETSLMGPGEGPRWDWSPAVKAHWCPQGHDS